MANDKNSPIDRDQGDREQGDREQTNREHRADRDDQPVDSSDGTYDPATDSDDDAVTDIASALPGSGRLGVSKDDLDGSSGPIQVP